jgi:hypothetical protein
MIRIEIDRVEPAFEGRSFGDTGPYEKIVGRMVATVDPDHPLNRVIVNLDKAPVDADDRVEIASDFYLLKPADIDRGNRAILYDVLNRGGKVALHALNDALRNPEGGMRIGCNEPMSIADAGNGFLMRQGFTLLWSGWQGGGVMAGDGRMAGSFPVATDRGVPIVATSRDEFVFDHLIDPVIAPLSYPASATDPASCTLTVRQRERDPRTPVSSDRWRFVSDMQIEIDRPHGFDAGAIYEFIYPARDPIVMGLGFAAVRDLVSFLRRAGTDDAGTPNPLAIDGRPAIDRALAFGVSQAGRFLRDFLHLGFNEDLAGRMVFDGLLPCMAGSRKSFVNYAFAQPGRFSRQHEDRLFPHDQFPFTYATTTDPVGGETDGILARYAASGTCPKIIQTETSSDFFQGRASLLVTDGKGDPVPVPDTVRFYLLAGVQHGGGGDPTVDYARMFPSTAYPPNLADCSHVHRALLTALDAWVTRGTPPPPSTFPSLADGSFVSASPEHYGFPDIPGVTYPGVINELSALDYDVQPPQPIAGRDYRVFVPAIDEDGNERPGVRAPDIAVPRGTHTGWTMRREGYAEGELGAIGAFLPFAATKEDRLASGDPRLSLEERYPTGADYLRKTEDAARELAARGLLLAEDVDRIVAAARARIGSDGLLR